MTTWTKVNRSQGSCSEITVEQESCSKIMSVGCRLWALPVRVNVREASYDPGKRCAALEMDRGIGDTTIFKMTIALT